MNLAQFLNVALLTQGAAAALAFAWLGAHDHAVARWFACLLIALGYTVVLALEFLMLLAVQTRDQRERAPVRRLIAAFLHEVLWVPVVFYWRQPFRSNRYPDSALAEHPAQPGVLLVHGHLCNRGLWNPWMRRYRERRIPYVAVNLEPFYGSIDSYGPVIDQAVRKLQAMGARPVVIVAHSMGGLAVRSWWRTTGGHPQVRRVVTIGTPHHGTWLARFALTANTRQMSPHGPWLESLARDEPPERYRTFTCLYSDCDNIVYPSRWAVLEGAENCALPNAAHLQMLFDERAFDAVDRYLR